MSTTADLVEGGWGEVAVAMAGKLSLRYARDGGAFSKFRKCFKEARKSFYVEVRLVPSKRNPTRESAWLSMRERFEL